MYIQCVPFPTDLQILLTLVMHPIKDKHMSGIIVCASPRLFCGHALKHAAAGNFSLRYLKSIDCMRFMCSRERWSQIPNHPQKSCTLLSSNLESDFVLFHSLTLIRSSSNACDKLVVSGRREGPKTSKYGEVSICHFVEFDCLRISYRSPDSRAALT